MHALGLDGVFAEDGSGALRFSPAPPPTDDDMDCVLAIVERRIRRLLVRRGIGAGVEEERASDGWVHAAPVLTGIAGASVQGRVALGPRAGAEVRRCGASPDLQALSSPALGPCHARQSGFDLHAGVVVAAGDRTRLERICRYALRPPLAHDRIRLTSDGDVLLELRHRWADGTTHLRFHPVELLERLAALTPRPRINLVLYYGVLGAKAAWRPRLRGRSAIAAGGEIAGAHSRTQSVAVASSRPRSNRLWAQLMQRSFGFDVLACPRCGERFRLIALIEDPRVIGRILDHLGLPTEVPAARPPRAPPIPFGPGGDRIEDDIAVP